MLKQDVFGTSTELVKVMGGISKDPQQEIRTGGNIMASSAETMILFNDMIRVGDLQNFSGKLGALGS